MNGRVPLKASYRLGLSPELIAQRNYQLQLRVRKSEPNEDAKLSEFQQELLQLAAVLKGDHIFTSYPDKIGKEMTVKQGNAYMEDALKRFFEAGLYAKSMGVDEEQIVQMRPSLTTRPSTPTTNQP
ncbi:hypothetical protein OIU77_028566 [Salix suchowensis]|uniref:Uncharacterized protein n=1 Tax=Salix suchowensis TaxID=1278906 RepID=A0ABQ9BLM0_9ROSI|nr:hypothetical protein OIU77_028566 [Salix suchowensis]